MSLRVSRFDPANAPQYGMVHRPPVLLLALGLAACSARDGLLTPGEAEPSRALGIWRPGPYDSCSREQHDAYGSRRIRG